MTTQPSSGPTLGGHHWRLWKVTRARSWVLTSHPVSMILWLCPWECMYCPHYTLCLGGLCLYVAIYLSYSIQEDSSNWAWLTDCCVNSLKDEVLHAQCWVCADQRSAIFLLTLHTSVVIDTSSVVGVISHHNLGDNDYITQKWSLPLSVVVNARYTDYRNSSKPYSVLPTLVGSGRT